MSREKKRATRRPPQDSPTSQHHCRQRECSRGRSAEQIERTLSLYNPPPPKRKRSRRLRKKLHVGEFQTLGFDYELTWPSKPSIEEQDRFIDQLLDEVAEPRGLSLGGGVSCGFVSARKGSPTEEDRLAFDVWLQLRPGVQSVEVGQLRDAWYHEPLNANRRAPSVSATAAPGAGLEGFSGVLAGKTGKSASVDELKEAASKGWTGELAKKD